ncbi:hypothetical protein I4J37_08690 [Corynebacterium belfantii]|uniref:hypothetical protein n=1 Tax=Corynebacterium belfantii TaxID=2014537 RepID=UPI0018D31D51|nr:hypothetical protein [Corynebacterium belfantii]MBG9319814.1 hypothetical protein [Corynebacterium belfantii]
MKYTDFRGTQPQFAGQSKDDAYPQRLVFESVHERVIGDGARWRYTASNTGEFRESIAVRVFRVPAQE